MPKPAKLHKTKFEPMNFSVSQDNDVVIHGRDFSEVKDPGGKHTIAVKLTKLDNGEEHTPTDLTEVVQGSHIKFIVPANTFTHHSESIAAKIPATFTHTEKGLVISITIPEKILRLATGLGNPTLTVTVTNPGADPATQPYPVTFTT